MDALAFEQLASLEKGHWWFEGRRALCMALARASFAGRVPTRILDAGAGAGGFLDPLETLGGEVHYLERDPAGVAACRGRGHRRGVLADGARLPYRTGSFDLVCLFDVLEHIEDDRAAVREATRVLAPGGRLLIHVPAHPWLYAMNDRISGHHRRYTRRRLRSLAREGGLQVERLSGSDLVLLPLIAPVVLLIKLLESLGWGRSQAHTNLSWRFPAWANALCAGLYRAEARWVARRDLPTGHSLAMVAQKVAQKEIQKEILRETLKEGGYSGADSSVPEESAEASASASSDPSVSAA